MRAKIVTMILAFSVVVVETAMIFFTILSSNTNRQDYMNDADNLSAPIAEVINAEDVYNLRQVVEPIVNNSPKKPYSDEWGSDEWNEYIAQFDAVQTNEIFLRLRDYLRKIEAANSSDVDCLYLSYVDSTNKAFVYLVDSAEEDDACPPGCLDPIYDFNEKIYTDKERGFPAYVTNTSEYGWLVTAGAPIHYNNDVVGYAMVDVSMARVRAAQKENIIMLFIYLTIAVLVVSAIGIVVTHFTLVKPVRTLKNATDSYDISNPDKTHDIFQKLEVKTHDELKDLSESLKKLENDIHQKIHEVTVAYDELKESQQAVERMTSLANKDGLTGVRNKLAYDRVVNKIDGSIKAGEPVQFGVVMIDLNYLKEINDDFGHDAGDASLIKLCNIICVIFAHSPVFRIGGDEFVVITRNLDYKRASVLIEEFNYKISELAADDFLELPERVSAALGYAMFDEKTDKCYQDVFKRADKAMYARKRQMKGEK